MNKKQQKTGVNPQTGLTPTQEQGAVLMASGETVTAVADKLNVNRGTIYKWFANVAFQCFYNRQCQDVKDEVKNGVLGLCGDAVSTLRTLIRDGNESTRLKACIWILERASQTTTGETDIREALKAQATHQTDITQLWDAPKLDKKEYFSLLDDYGVSVDD